MTRIGRVLLALVLLGTATPAPAGEPLHLGVASCSGSTCHGRSVPTGTVVRQDELGIWQDTSTVAGAHSRAYRSLLTERSRTMARMLGLSKPAHEAPECLMCHADPISADRRGPQYQLSDGVTCEACHGASENWLAPHYAVNVDRADLLARGLVPLEDPRVRADVCLACHSSTTAPGRFVSHRLMGAGHPRLSFELDLFSALQAHHTVDADYQRRKDPGGGALTWAVGQAIALQRTLEALVDARTGMDGMFPELVFFDCHACHQTISDARDARSGWRPNPGRPLGPGIPTLNDANLIMLKAIAQEAAPDLSARLDAQGRALHAAVTRDRATMVSAARALARTSQELASRLSNATFTGARMRNVLQRIVSGSIGREFTNYAGAEQAVMAIDTLLSALEQEGIVPTARAAELRPQIDAAYDATRTAFTYRPEAFRSVLVRINDGIAKW
jgi:hypothetical protein